MPAKRKPGTAGTPTALIMSEKLVTLVHHLRLEKVILDFDPAELYGISTKRHKEAVKRNLERFTADFMFQLPDAEVAGLRCQSGILNAVPDSPLPCQSGRANSGDVGRTFPYDFIERGVAMQSSGLQTSPHHGGEYRFHGCHRPAPAPVGHQSYITALDARMKAIAYIVGCNNIQRKHSAHGYQP
jgi:hypothetical protein